MLDDGIMLRSEANLIAARGAEWGAEARETARLILDRIAAQGRARAFREVRTRSPGVNDAVLKEAKARFGVAAPFGGPTSSGMLTLHCPPGQVHALASFLREKGAESVTVADIDYVFSRDNPLYAKLESRAEGLDVASRALRAEHHEVRDREIHREAHQDRDRLGAPRPA